jgi:hypothetical protein
MRNPYLFKAKYTLTSEQIIRGNGEKNVSLTAVLKKTGFVIDIQDMNMGQTNYLTSREEWRKWLQDS